MPVTKTAKRALRGSAQKKNVNDTLRTKLDVAMRIARKKPTAGHVNSVFSLSDRAVKKHIIHKNKAARLKSAFSKLIAGK
jgi:small subunit ribosomal protein S20